MLATREGHVRYLGEQVEALAGLAGDGFGEQLAGQVRGVDAVAGIGLGMEHVGLILEATDLRQAIGADADHAAPLIVDAHVGQLREHLEHLRPHVAGDVRRVASGVVAGATEQQAAVGREPVVVHGHALVAQRHVLRNQLTGLFLGQLLGGDDVAAGRQHLAAEARVESVDVGVAGQHQEACADLALRGVHAHLVAIVDAGDRRLLEQLHAQRLRRGGFAERQVERVQVARTHVDHGTVVVAGTDYLVDALLRNQTQLVAVAEAFQLGLVLGETVEMGRLVGQVAVAPGQVAVDLEALDTLAHDLHRLQAHQLELAHAFLAHHRLELLDVMAHAANQLPAVAPAGAPADPARFQQCHRQAFLGQLDGGVQAAEAAADDAHIHLQLAAQGRVGLLAIDAGGVVGSGMLWAVDGLLNAGVHVRNPDFGVWKI